MSIKPKMLMDLTVKDSGIFSPVEPTFLRCLDQNLGMVWQGRDRMGRDLRSD